MCTLTIECVLKNNAERIQQVNDLDLVVNNTEEVGWVNGKVSYIFIYVYACIYVYICVCVYLYVYICVCVYIYICMCMYICIYMCV